VHVDVQRRLAAAATLLRRGDAEVQQQLAQRLDLRPVLDLLHEVVLDVVAAAARALLDLDRSDRRRDMVGPRLDVEQVVVRVEDLARIRQADPHQLGDDLARVRARLGERLVGELDGVGAPISITLVGIHAGVQALGLVPDLAPLLDLAQVGALQLDLGGDQLALDELEAGGAAEAGATGGVGHIEAEHHELDERAVLVVQLAQPGPARVPVLFHWCALMTTANVDAGDATPPGTGAPHGRWRDRTRSATPWFSAVSSLWMLMADRSKIQTGPRRLAVPSLGKYPPHTPHWG
jgi:hypothetical protein